MNTAEYDWESLAAMLRKEIEEYGVLFSILEAQRDSLLTSNLDGIYSANHELEQQAQSINALRSVRLNAVSELSIQMGLEGEEAVTVKRIIQEAPSGVQLMLESIIQEVERLIHASRNYLKRNQMLICRASDVNRQFLDVLNPSGKTVASYRRNGVLANTDRRTQVSTYLARA